MEKAKLKTLKSDFNIYEDRQKQLDESHSKGKEIYVKGGKNGKKK